MPYEIVGHPMVDGCDTLYCPFGRFNGHYVGHYEGRMSDIYKPNHLAILTGERDACSVAAGCGITANAGDCECGCGGDCGDGYDSLGFPATNRFAEPRETPRGLPELFEDDRVTTGNRATLGLPKLF